MKFFNFFEIFLLISSLSSMEYYPIFNENNNFSRVDLKFGRTYIINESYTFKNDCIISGNQNSLLIAGLNSTNLLTLSEGFNITFMNISFQLSYYGQQINYFNIFFIEDNGTLAFKVKIY